ncbi:S41 family peptidase [Feifania hominis]|uniref:S41 family peptidase n=1 Tax=Feifania hominis TaxID=2763660 RepID=A0A926DCB4_9FIRM|nr:S41 family peptidase [Feifania hominis]MBC8535591.1 S41 family peptidase [Feifania hominis]
MNRRISLKSVLLIVLGVVLVTFLLTATYFQLRIAGDLREINEKNAYFSKLYTVDQLVRDHYVGDIDAEELMDGIITGYIYGTGDKYAAYLNRDVYAESVKSSSGQFEGIGINIMYMPESGYIKITSPMQNSPAEKAGILAGDIIIEVDGEDVAQLGYYSAVAKLTDVAGTSAHFTVLRGEQTIPFSITRESFEKLSVFSRVVGDNIGYIQIEAFNETTYREFELAIDELTGKGVRGLIFDVRNNPGGDVNTLCNMLDLLLPEGPIMHMYDHDGNEELPAISSDASEIDLPMAVLVNGDSASASELFAAALRDYDKAKLVGTKTYGKATMQSVIPLSDGSAVSISVSAIKPPYGDSYEGIGITPDFVVDLPDEVKQNYAVMTDEQDAQLQRALELFS